MVRPLTTDSGCVLVGRRRASASSSRRFTSSHWRPPVRLSDQPPVSFSPSSQNDAWPASSASPIGSSRRFSYVPRSQTITGPAPYSPSGITPSKSPHESEWSSTSMARRLSRGSVEGPFGTAQDLKVPSTSSRKSQCMLVAACCWITKRGMSGGPRAERLDLQRALVPGLHLERGVVDPEALLQHLRELAAMGLGVAARPHGDMRGQGRHARGDLPHVQVVHLDHVILGGER